MGDGGRCVCATGYHLSTDFNRCIIPHSFATYHEFTFDACMSQYESNNVELVGASFDSSEPFPLPVHHRGVFLSNKTYFEVNNLIFSSNFAMNAWVKSHDTGFGTLFSSNILCDVFDNDIINFAWRVSNHKVTERKRTDMIELQDFTREDSHFQMKAHDESYKPKTWSNIGYSVSYDWEDGVSTITFYGYDCAFYIRAQLSTP